MPLLRVPYTDPLPLPTIIPRSAKSTSGAIAALLEFLAPSLSQSSVPQSNFASKLTTSAKGVRQNGKTLLLTGAGISVASGLADYRGVKGTYTLNKTYKPIYYNEFCENHEARKRYWARSFLGWTNLDRAKPNHAHRACGELGKLGVVGDVITQSAYIYPILFINQEQHLLQHVVLQTWSEVIMLNFGTRRRLLSPNLAPLPPHHRTPRLPPLPRLRHLPQRILAQHLPIPTRAPEPHMVRLPRRDAGVGRPRH
jgi:hypothetical protein